MPVNKHIPAKIQAFNPESFPGISQWQYHFSDSHLFSLTFSFSRFLLYLFFFFPLFRFSISLSIIHSKKSHNEKINYTCALPRTADPAFRR